MAAFAAAPIRNLSVTLRGKRYDIDADVETVGQLKEQVAKVSGIDSPQSVLYNGQRLADDAVLGDVGVEEGSNLNMVPATTSTKKKKKTSTTTTSTTTTASVAANPMANYLQQAGVDAAQFESMLSGNGDMPDMSELMKSLGGDGKMPDMKESLDMMSSMMNSPMFKEYMSDPEKLEESRQMILSNPMLKSMMAGMPGMQELLEDKDAWCAAMQAAASMYSQMDSDTLMKAMMGGGGAGGMPTGGLFDGTLDQSTAAAALDELDEDD